jgi:hypothetical protein
MLYELYSEILPLGAIAQGELWPPEQSSSILLYSSSFLPINPSLMSISVQSIHPRLIVWFLNNFYVVRLLASRPIPNLEDQGVALRLALTP